MHACSSDCLTQQWLHNQENVEAILVLPTIYAIGFLICNIHLLFVVFFGQKNFMSGKQFMAKFIKPCAFRFPTIPTTWISCTSCTKQVLQMSQNPSLFLCICLHFLAIPNHNIYVYLLPYLYLGLNRQFICQDNLAENFVFQFVIQNSKNPFWWMFI